MTDLQPASARPSRVPIPATGVSKIDQDVGPLQPKKERSQNPMRQFAWFFRVPSQHIKNGREVRYRR